MAKKRIKFLPSPQTSRTKMYIPQQLLNLNKTYSWASKVKMITTSQGPEVAEDIEEVEVPQQV